jgi:hypothetical protein
MVYPRNIFICFAAFYLKRPEPELLSKTKNVNCPFTRKGGRGPFDLDVLYGGKLQVILKKGR